MDGGVSRIAKVASRGFVGYRVVYAISLDNQHNPSGSAGAESRRR